MYFTIDRIKLALDCVSITRYNNGMNDIKDPTRNERQAFRRIRVKIWIQNHPLLKKLGIKSTGAIMTRLMNGELELIRKATHEQNNNRQKRK